MGREMSEGDSGVVVEAVAPLESRPGIFLIGSPNVGKRTILSRLLSVDLSDALDAPDSILCHGWTIDTKYYSADVSIWTAELDDGFSLGSLPVAKHLAALVLVFDLNDLSSFVALQDWVSGIDIQRFEILLCIGNKADLLPGHFAHVEYRRHLQKCGESSSDPHPEFIDYGIHETEATSLLGDEEPSWEIRKSYLEWCIQHNMEYVEACASNADFDKCLSVNGDMQGVDRLYGALSAHMWPGMTLKSGNKIAEPFPVEKEEESDEESEFKVEYEILSGGFDEPWDGSNDSWVDFSEAEAGPSTKEGLTSVDVQIAKPETSGGTKDQILTSEITSPPEVIPREIAEETAAEISDRGNSLISDSGPEHEEEGEASPKQEEQGESSGQTPKITVQEDSGSKVAQTDELNEDMNLEYDDMERLMSEIGNMRGSLRLIPDFQRREVAAKLAMKMAVMFGCSSDEEGFE